MLRALLTGLAILHLGPGLAFALLAFGCTEQAQWLPSLCQGNQLRAFGLITVVAWVVMGVGAVLLARMKAQTPDRPGPVS